MQRTIKYGLILSLLVWLSVSCNNTKTITKETRVSSEDTYELKTETIKVDGEALKEIRTRWDKDYITATGKAPLLERYDNEYQNRELSRRAAITDAKRNLALQISETSITEEVIMRDLEQSEVVKTEMTAILQNVEVLSEFFDEANNVFEVEVRMPKMVLYKVIEKYVDDN